MKLKTTAPLPLPLPPLLIHSHRKRTMTMFILLSKSNNSHSHSLGSSDSGATPPPRITSNLKQNLHFLKLFKDFQKRNSSTPTNTNRPSTSYRRKKVDKDNYNNDDDDDDDDDDSFDLSSLYYTHNNNNNNSSSAAAPVLLVDGYNVCGYWLKLKKHFINGRLDIARHKLLLELVTFSALRDLKVVAVFDAMMSGLPSHKDNFSGVDVIFSADTCADTWIEKEVAALKEDGCPKVWVVTSDHCQQQAAHGAGAFVWSCKALVTEIKSSHKEVERMLQEQRSTSFQGRLLKHNLDAEVVDALKNLRQKLSENDLK